ncbi:MAG: tRNA dihydrouridine synthase DusB [Nitriliruptoraceae bacterium]
MVPDRAVSELAATSFSGGATAAVAGPLHLRGLRVWPPVVLAPMAGVTNVAFRALCRRYGGGLYVSEMVGARGLLEGDARSQLKAAFGPDEQPRSIQLYATDPTDTRAAVRLLVTGDPQAGRAPVDHIDLNFGCPAPKVTRHGGGSALPWRTDLYTAIVAAAVEAAGEVPVTVKLRVGIDDEHHTYRDAGRIAQDLGVAAVALHARTAEQRYGPPAQWHHIAQLAADLTVPVLGNGDILEGADATRMLAETGCAGVVVGRGCLGRPWLFRDLEAALSGRAVPPAPCLGEICDLLAEHARLLVDHLGEPTGLRELRKHTGWYLQGFPVGRPLRRALNQVSTYTELVALLAGLDRDLPFDESVRRHLRGHTTAPKRVVLPHGWLATRHHGLAAAPDGTAVSGG